MANLNYHKFLRFCNKQIDENPFLVKAILIHIALIILLYILSFVSSLKFEKTQASLSVQVSNMPKKFEIIQATSISSSELNKQISAYENHQQELKQAREDIKQAKLQALKKHQQQLKEKAEAERKAKQQAILEAKKKAQQEAQRKAEQEKQAKLEAERKAKVEAEQKAQQELQRKKEQELKAKQQAEEKARAEAEASAKREVAKNQANLAVGRYIAEYASRVSENWVKDDCRGIYDFPEAISKNGKFIKLTGTSGSYACDQSLIEAVKNTTPPKVSNIVAMQTIQNENVRFKFEQK